MPHIRHITILSSISITVLAWLFVPSMVFAACTCTGTPPPDSIPADKSDCEALASSHSCSWTDSAPTSPSNIARAQGVVELINPIGGTEQNKAGTSNIPEIIGKLIAAALGIAGSIALAAFVYGSFVWLTSAGKSDKVQQGSRTMLYAVVGLFIIFSAYGILNQVIGALTR